MSVKLRHERDSLEEIIDKRTEALQENEQRWEDLFNRTSNAIAIYAAIDDGQDFIFKGFNPAGERIEGVRREDIIGHRVTEVFPGVKAFGIFDVFQRVWKTGKPEHFNLGFYKDERVEGWRDNYIYKLNTCEIVAVYEDTTIQKQAEAALKESERKYRSVIDNAVEGVFQSTPDGKLLMVNPAFVRMLGYDSSEEMIECIIDISNQLYVNRDQRKEIIHCLNEKGA